MSGFSNTGAPEDEGQHLQSVVPTAAVYGGPGRFGMSADSHLTERSELATSKNGEKLFQEWAKFWDLSRPCLLEKSPPNLIRTRFLQALFPNSFFVIIYRHPIAVSLATQKWSETSLSSLIEHWLHCHAEFERDRQRLRHSLVIRYEDLIQQSGLSLHKVKQFLGLSGEFSATLNSGANSPYFSAWRKLAADEKDRKLVNRLIERYEEKVMRYGYSMRNCEALYPAATFSP